VKELHHSLRANEIRAAGTEGKISFTIAELDRYLARWRERDVMSHSDGGLGAALRKSERCLVRSESHRKSEIRRDESGDTIITKGVVQVLVKDGRPIECSDKEEFERRKALCELAMKHLPVEQKRRHYEG
jgi:hypothetical protein